MTNRLDPARLPVRAALIGLALVGLVMSVSIFESFGARGLTFAIAYVMLQIGRTVFTIAAVARHDRDLSHDFVRVLIWLAASGVFWVLGGLVPIELRIWSWLIALGESFLITDFAFVAQESSVVGVASVLLAFVNAATLWWLYFDHAERAGAKAIARADKPGRIGNRAYTHTHAIIVAAIVLGSVADKRGPRASE